MPRKKSSLSVGQKTFGPSFGGEDFSPRLIFIDKSKKKEQEKEIGDLLRRGWYVDVGNSNFILMVNEEIQDED